MSALLGFASGVFLFTFIEYVLHRWGGHASPNGVLGYSVRKHLNHHTTPTYFPRTQQKLGAVMMFVPCGIMVLVAGWPAALGMLAGLGGGLALYEFVHMNMHNRQTPPRTAYGRWVSQLHLHHHFVDAKMNHGITSPLWDWVFRTYRAPGVVTVPDKAGVSPRWILAQPLDQRLEGRFAVRGREQLAA